MEEHYHAGLLAKQLHNLADQILAQAMEKQDLTPAQAHILGYLVRHRQEQPCQRDVENCFGLSHPTVSGVLARLEDKGFVTFSADEVDHRKKRLQVTAKAIECDAQIHRAIGDMEARIVRDFTDSERELLLELLSRGICNLGGEPCKIHDCTRKEEPK